MARESTNNKELYLYEDPFVVQDTQDNRYEYLSDSVKHTEYERQDESGVFTCILNFGIAQDIVEVKNSVITPVTKDPNIQSWQWFSNWQNFRSLVDVHEYNILLEMLTSNNQNPINHIINLHSSLGVLFDEKLLNTLVHRTISSISQIPYNVPDTSTRQSWYSIHKQTPYLWILIALQAMRTATISFNKQP